MVLSSVYSNRSTYMASSLRTVSDVLSGDHPVHLCNL